MVATSNLIADRLRTAILRGELRSEESLPQDKLAHEMGVSKIPLREALAELKVEGLVTYKSNRGAFVTALSAQDARELYLMRTALETLALEQAIPKLGKTDIARANSALLMIDAEDDARMWAELNWDFHRALYSPAGMPNLVEMIQQLHVNVGRYIVLYLDQMAFQSKSQAEHYQILEACQAGDLDAALGTLTRHLEDASQSLQAYLTTSREGDA